MSKIEAIIFDLDGTLVDTEPKGEEAIREWALEAGLKVPDQAFREIVGRKAVDALGKIIELSEGKRKELITVERAVSEVKTKYRAIIRRGVQEIPGAVEFVKRMASQYPIAVVSGSMRDEIELILTQLGVMSDFRFYLGAEDYAPGKPDPAGFLSAFNRIGVSSVNTLIFEDSVPGVTAALASGGLVVRVTGAKSSIEMGSLGAHHVIKDYSSLQDSWINQILRN